MEMPRKSMFGDMHHNVSSQAELARQRAEAATMDDGEHAHLGETVTVGKTARKRATIEEPMDFLRVAMQPRENPTQAGRKGSFYRQISQPLGPGRTPVTTGRVQDPTHKHAADDERFSYIHAQRGAPSYPTAAQHLKTMGKAHGLEEHEMIGAAMDTAMGEGQEGFSEKETRQLASPMMINNISEQRRSPSMALFSAQAMDLASDKSSGVDLSQLYGVKSGKVNLPGLAPATGTGGKGVWKSDVEPSLADPTRVPGAKGKRVLENVRSTHRAMMKRHYDPATTERLEREGATPEFIDAGARLHMNSFAARRAAIATGQLRPLRTKVSSGYTLQGLEKTIDKKRDRKRRAALADLRKKRAAKGL